MWEGNKTREGKGCWNPLYPTPSPDKKKKRKAGLPSPLV